MTRKRMKIKLTPEQIEDRLDKETEEFMDKHTYQIEDFLNVAFLNFKTFGWEWGVGSSAKCPTRSEIEKHVYDLIKDIIRFKTSDYVECGRIRVEIDKEHNLLELMLCVL